MVDSSLNTGPLTIKGEAEYRYLIENPSFASLYHLRFAVRVSGYEDAEILVSAIDRTRRRHGALRTLIQLDRDGTPVQVVLPHSALSPTAIKKGTQEHLESYLREVPQPERDSLFDAQIFLLPDGDCVIGFKAHHLLIDEWSKRLLLTQMIDLCRNPGSEVENQPEACQFIDHCRAERRDLASGKLDEGIRYWSEYMAGAKTISLGSNSRQRQGAPSVARTWEFSIDAQIFNRMAVACRTRGLPTGVICLSLFNLAISSIAGVQRGAFATPMLGRVREGSMESVGSFSNTAYISHPVNASDRLEDYAAEFCGAAAGVLSHQAIFLGGMCPGVPLPSLYPIRFNVVLFDSTGGFADEAQVKPIVKPISMSKNQEDITERQLSVILSVSRGKVRFNARFAKDVVSEEVIKKLVSNFLLFASAFTDYPSRRISDITN